MDITITKEYHSIEEVKQSFPTEKIDGTIFRGQSNGAGIKQENWKIESSFNRIYPNGEPTFREFLITAQDLLFDNNINEYKYHKIPNLKSLSHLQKIYFFQHYGIPTCLIDFTKDPIIALFFAMSSVHYPSHFLSDGNAKKNLCFNNNRYISVYQVNIDILKKQIPKLDSLTDDNIKYYNNQFEICEIYPSLNFAFDLYPESGSNNILYNLEKQKGCFIFFDSANYKIDLLSSIEETIDYNNQNNTSTNPIVIEHQFFLQDLITNNKNSLIHYITKEKKITGKNLFDDIQGIKYDLNYAPLMWTTEWPS